MWVIQERFFIGGAEKKMARLGLQRIWEELEDDLCKIDPRLKEQPPMNSGREASSMCKRALQKYKMHTEKGKLRWGRCRAFGEATVCIGIELRVLGSSDLLVLDVVHLRDELTTGNIDIGVMVVPSDELAAYLTGRVARFTDAKKALERARAADLPIVIIALR